MEILDLPTVKSKDVFTAKTSQGYVGCVHSSLCFYVTTERFSTALQAANAARKLRKDLGITPRGLVTPVSKDSAKAKKSSKKRKNTVAWQDRLYTLAEVEAMPLLRFREVWIIVHGNEFVADCLNYTKKEVVKFSAFKAEAKLFSCHEEAKNTMRTLRGVIGPGFNLMRLFVENK